MARTCCLAGIDVDEVAMLGTVLRKAGAATPATVARFNVTEVGALQPGLLLCDIDASEVDPLEFVRRLRFVLPDCIIAVYTGRTTRSWALSCHLAGANCLLSKESSAAELALGLRQALRSGCFTDSRFDTAHTSPDRARAGRLVR